MSTSWESICRIVSPWDTLSDYKFFINFYLFIFCLFFVFFITCIVVIHQLVQNSHQNNNLTSNGKRCTLKSRDLLLSVWQKYTEKLSHALSWEVYSRKDEWNESSQFHFTMTKWSWWLTLIVLIWVTSEVYFRHISQVFSYIISFSWHI